jgi:PhnB protein
MLEIDMVVPKALAAFALYQHVFGATVLEKSTDEVICMLQGTRFHLFDENPVVGWQAPSKDTSQSSWFNVITDDAEALFARGTEANFETIVPLRAEEALGVKNAVVRDPFGYSWVIEQILRKISFEERCKILAERKAR